MRAAKSGFAAEGALGPSQAFEPKPFLAELERFEVRWQVDVGQVPAGVEA
jgi:hypothetical protein